MLRAQGVSKGTALGAQVGSLGSFLSGIASHLYMGNTIF